MTAPSNANTSGLGDLVEHLELALAVANTSVRDQERRATTAEARADRLAKVMTELMPAVRAYVMTGDVMSQSIKRNTWNPVLAHAAAALQQEG